MKEHVTLYENSPRLQRLVAFMEKRGKRGATTGAQYYFTRNCGLPQSFFDLAHELNGFKIRTEFERTTKAGGKVFRRWLLGRHPKRIWMAARRAAGRA